MPYELILRVGLCGCVGLALWFIVGFIMFFFYHACWSIYNPCWMCMHGQVRDPIARWFARRLKWGFHHLILLVAPILVPFGIVTFCLVQLPFDRDQAGTV